MQIWSWLYLPGDVEIGDIVLQVEGFTVRRLRHNEVELGACLVTLNHARSPQTSEVAQATAYEDARDVPVTYVSCAPEDLTPHRVLRALDIWVQWFADMKHAANMITQRNTDAERAESISDKSPVWQAQIVPWLLRERRPLDIVVRDAIEQMMIHNPALLQGRTFQATANSHLATVDDMNHKTSPDMSQVRQWLAKPVEYTMLQGDLLWNVAPFAIYRIWVERIGGRKLSMQFRTLMSAEPTELHRLFYVDKSGVSQCLELWATGVGVEYSASDVVSRVRGHWLLFERHQLAQMISVIRQWPANGDQGILERLRQIHAQRTQRVRELQRALRSLST